MTDIMTGALAAFAGPELLFEYPDELNTGGDLDLRFWHAASGRDVHVRLQAKRLNAATNAGKPVGVASRSYAELLHKPPSSSMPQYKTLAATAAPIIPLYMFYNHHSVVDDPFHSGPGPVVSGVNLAFAADIARELDRKVAAAGKIPKQVLHHKRLKHLRTHFFVLDAILCPGGDWEGAGVPSPNLVSASLRDRWNDGTRNGPITTADDPILRRLSEPLHMLPSSGDRRRPADGSAVRVDKALDKPLITFISGRTDDDRTPLIYDAPRAGAR